MAVAIAVAFVVLYFISVVSCKCRAVVSVGASIAKFILTFFVSGFSPVLLAYGILSTIAFLALVGVYASAEGQGPVSAFFSNILGGAVLVAIVCIIAIVFQCTWLLSVISGLEIVASILVAAFDQPDESGNLE